MPVEVDRKQICSASLLLVNVALAELFSRVHDPSSFATFECALGLGEDGKFHLLPCRCAPHPTLSPRSFLTPTEP